MAKLTPSGSFFLLITISLTCLNCVNCQRTRQGAPKKLDCDKQVYISDKCLQRAVFINNASIPVPRNAEDLLPYCVTMRSDLRCINDLKYCLKPFPRTVFNVIFRNIRKLFTGICKPNTKEQREFLEHTKCFNPEDIYLLHDIAFKFTRFVDHVAKNSKSDEIIPSLCCGLFVANTGIKKTYDDLCKPRTGIETGTYYVKMFGGSFTEALDLGCGQFTNTDVCEDKFPDFMRTMKNIISTSVKAKYSPIVPLTQILQRLDGEINLN